MPVQTKLTSPFLYDSSNGRMVGVKDADGYENLWARNPRIGSFWDNLTQGPSAATAAAMLFRQADTSINNGVSIVSNSRITVDRAATYNIMFSAQFANSGAGSVDASVWLAVNGTAVPATNGFVTVHPKHGSINGHTMAVWNYFIYLTPSQYAELYWSGETADITIEATGTQTGPVRPATPSIILTVNEVAFTI